MRLILARNFARNRSWTRAFTTLRGQVPSLPMAQRVLSFPKLLSPERVCNRLQLPLPRALSTAVSDDAEKELVLESWAAAIPHPQKKATGGEDSYFILERSPADGSSAIGVADGVGGWAELGIDSGEYSRALMKHAKIRLQSDVSPPCPVDALSVAYRMVCVQGSSTACLVVLHNRTLEALNLGDSGFVLLRPEEDTGKLQVIAESKEQTHGFNFPFQLGTGSLDYPHHGDFRSFDVLPRDVIVMATDGLWDNVHQADVVTRVQECCDDSELNKAAGRLAVDANRIGRDHTARSPFAERAWAENKLDFPGGKLDDVTVVVSQVSLAPSRSDIPLL